jgi:hypothetical protein
MVSIVFIYSRSILNIPEDILNIPEVASLPGGILYMMDEWGV